MKTTEKLLYWTPRILSILFIGFLTLFSLDVFESKNSVGEILAGLFMHNIPSIIMTIMLVIAWRKEIVGAATYFGAGLLYVGLVAYSVINRGLPWFMAVSWSITIAGPAFFIGTLFLAGWLKRKAINKSDYYKQD